MTDSHSTVREGATAGLIGAAVLAVWYLVIDLSQGRPFHMPMLIAELLFGGAASDAGAFGAIAVVTIVHGTVLILVGIALAGLVHLSARNLEWRMALVIAMTIALVFFFGLGYAAGIAQGEPIPYWIVFTGGLLAVIGMGWYLWHNHPRLVRSFSEVQLGNEGDVVSHPPE